MGQNYKRSRNNDKAGPPAKRWRGQQTLLLPLQLMDLPTELQERIMNKLHFRSQMLLRRASEPLCGIHSCYIRHFHKCFVHRQRLNDSEEGQKFRSTLRVIDQVTSIYVNSGYEAHYYDSLLSFYENLQAEEPVNHPFQLNCFIRHFYDILENEPDQSRRAQRGLIYFVSLFNLLRQFRTFHVRKSFTSLMHWNLEVEVRGAFLCVLPHCTANPQDMERSKRINFISIIGELLYYDLMETDVHQYSQIISNDYVYGLHQNPTRTYPYLILKFNILVRDEVKRFMETALAGQLNVNEAVPLMELMPFSVQMGVNTRNLSKWIGREDMLVVIAPLQWNI